MSFWNSLVDRFRGPKMTVAPSAVPESGSRAARTKQWSPAQITGVTLTKNARTIRDRSRAAWTSDAYARGGIERKVAAICGTGVKPLSQSPDAAFRKQVHEAWFAWTENAGAGLTKDFYALMTSAVREWLVSGEAWIRLRTRRPEDGIPAAPLQLELLPAEAVAEDLTQQSNESRAVVQGVEIDAIGKVRGYHIRRKNITTGQYDQQPSFVKAEEIVHLFAESFPGQLRGLPELSSVLFRLRQLDLFEDAVLTRAQLSNLVTAFITGGDDLLPEDEDGVVSLTPGTFQRLAPGESVNWSEPPSLDGSNYETFVRAQLQAVASALGTSYADLTGDARDLTDRVLRIQRLDWLRHIEMLTHQVVAPALSRIFEVWYAAAVEAGTLKPPTKDAAHAKVEWTAQRFPHFSPDQEANAAETNLRLGLTSRSAMLAADGLDPEAVDAEIAQDNARADSLNLKFDGDARSGGKTAPAPSGPATPSPAPGRPPIPGRN